MHRTALLQAAAALSAVAMLAACSGGSSFAPAAQPDHVSPLLGHRFTNFSSCPAHGSIIYVSDLANNVIDAYAGKFLGQAPCARIGIGHLNFPSGLTVDTATHDLYVANMRDFDVLVFHRGQTTAYNTYTDASGQLPQDVVLTPDGTVIASNAMQYGGPEAGSLSTWIKGSSGGTFVGNFPMTNDTRGGFLAVDASGTVYFNDIDSNSNLGALWKVSCPAGVCGLQTQQAGVTFQSPGGLAFDRTNDLLAIDPIALKADTFELPHPKPKTFSLFAGSAVGLAINASGNRLFAADPNANNAAEYRYPSGTLVGTVPGNQGGFPVGIAIDP
jgi:DNA-binding beta-propeller fold protein YncE